MRDKYELMRLDEIQGSYHSSDGGSSHSSHDGYFGLKMEDNVHPLSFSRGLTAEAPPFHPSTALEGQLLEGERSAPRPFVPREVSESSSRTPLSFTDINTSSSFAQNNLFQSKAFTTHSYERTASLAAPVMGYPPGSAYPVVSQQRQIGSPPSPDLNLSREQVILYEGQSNTILQVCGPHEEQLEYRSSVIALLQHNIRLALGSAALDISLQVLNCFLPDDPIKLSVILVKTVNPSSDFSAVLEEQFKLLAESSLRRSIQLGGGAGGMGRGGGAVLGEEGSERAQSVHLIKGVKVTKHNVGIKLICSVDSYIDVEIVFNNRNDLCMLTFVEEVSLLVGKNNLFKRALMLIRTWWFYETAAYMGTSIKHYLSDFSLCVMIIAIFNQFYKLIDTPVEALCLFLNTYADYDGHNYAITLQGIVPFQNGPLNNQPRLRLSGGDFLIDNQILDKYSYMFRVGHQLPQSREQLAINNALISASTKFCGNYASDSAEIYQVTLGLSRRAVDGNSKPIYSSKIEGFTRSTFNIVHPFTYSNMITVNLSHTRLTKLTRAFRLGKQNLAAVLGATSADARHLSQFYPVFLARFPNNWRPDVVGGQLTAAGARESYL